jgi:ATP-dependent Clp protease protease subunit
MTFYFVCPVGIPRVAARLPGEASYQWTDIYNRLYRARILFLCSQIEDEIANQICALLVYLNAENPDRDIFLFINSLGGYMTSGLAIVDTMNFVRANVSTVNLGYCASMASLVLASGEKGRRWAFPHARALVHQPLGGVSGQALYLRLEALEVVRLRRIVAEMYLRVTLVSKDFLVQLLDSRDLFLRPSQQVEFGLIDTIGASTTPLPKNSSKPSAVFSLGIFTDDTHWDYDQALRITEDLDPAELLFGTD